MSWYSLPIKDVARVVTGNTPPKSEEDNYGGEIPWVKLPELGSTVPITRTHETLSTKGATKARIVPSGAILVSCIGTIGRVGIAGTELATNQQINAVVCGPAIEPRFAMYWFMRNSGELSAAANKAVVPILNKGNFEQIKIPVWPQSEQRRVVEILDQAERICSLRHAADAKAARILPALFLNMFGDPATNPMGWTMSTIGELSDGRPEYGANASARPMTEGRPRYIRITDIRDDGTLSGKEIVTLDADDWVRYLLKAGDVLFARSGNTVGKSYIYRASDGECAFAGYLIRFQFNSSAVDPWFIFGITRTSFYRGWVESNKRVAGQPNINGQEYAGLKIPVPPPEMQRQFASYARDIERFLVQINDTGERLDELFTTLLSQAFSGHLTAKWRDAHMKELLAEMEAQTHLLNLKSEHKLETVR